MTSTLLWRWGSNFRRAFDYTRNASNIAASPLSAALRSDGIVTTKASDFFDPTGKALLDDICELTAHKLGEVQTRELLEKKAASKDRKDYMVHLFNNQYDVESPFIQIALQPSFLSIASNYLGMFSSLRAVEVWLHFPTPGDAKETQLWHMDADDVMNVKVFIYLNDVGEQTGPFCYIPGSHPLGTLKIAPRTEASGRVTDESMAAVVKREKWRVCTGPAGTMTLADTRGYHKGLKPQSGHRVLLMIQYTSGTSPYPSSLMLQGSSKREWDLAQRYALAGHNITARD